MRATDILTRYRQVLIALGLSLLYPALASAQMAAGQEGLWSVPRVGGETITEPSPEATAMRRYQDFPVSYATGTADISIPLLELPGGQVGVSLGLRYHTGGIKRNDISTGVGLGWSLTGLGQVSRQINGFPDEWKGSGSGCEFDLRENSDDVDYFKAILEARKDTEYDRYSYDIPGYSGCFIIRDGIIVQLPQTELIIERIPETSNPDATDSFIITTPDGIKYRFEDKERIEYKNITDPLPVPAYSYNYNCISTWNLSHISAPEDADGISITYTEATQWSRSHDLAMRSFSYCHTNKPGAEGITSSGADVNNMSTSITRFTNQRLPLKITGRSGTIEFSIERKFSTSAGQPDRISAVTLKDATDNTISQVNLHASLFLDKRSRLDRVEIKRDNTLTHNYRFEYKLGAIGELYDMFGFSNGKHLQPDCHSILDYDLSFADSRKTDLSHISANSLIKITDIAGAVTSLEYEPAVINIGGNGLLNGDVTVGIRLRSVTVQDNNKPVRKRTRSYKYYDARCNIELDKLDISHLISHSGVYTAEPVNGSFLAYYDVYNLGTTFTASAGMRGYPFENARVYYAVVEETLSGTGIETPIKTTYEYDIDDCINRYVPVGGISGSVEDQRHLGIIEGTALGLTESYRRALMPHPTAGYNEEIIGASPMLVRKTMYENIGGSYTPRVIEETFTTAVESERLCSGLFCESNVRKIYYAKTGATEMDIQTMNDINCYPVYITARRYQCDSIRTTVVYSDTERRTIKTSYLYDGTISTDSLPLGELKPLPFAGKIIIRPLLNDYRLPGFDCDTLKYNGSRKSFYPLGKVASSGGESIASYCAMSEYAGMKLKTAGCTLNRLPVAEKWVLRTADGCDSLLRRYEYGRFSCGGHTLTRPTRVYVQSDGSEESRALISSQRYTGYDRRGRITSMTDSEGRRIVAEWDDEYDMLMSMSLPDVGLTTSYTIQPLVGYTSITSPSGKVRRFAYSAGRLVAERNTANELIASYTYRLAGDGTSADGRNRFTATVHDTNGTATETTYYDCFGLPVQTVSTVADGNLVRSAIEYDALDRPVRQYRPVPATDPGYSISYASDAVSHYGDSRPYSTVSYRNMGGRQAAAGHRRG